MRGDRPTRPPPAKSPLGGLEDATRSGLARLLARLWPWPLIVYLGWVAASWLIAAVVPDVVLRLTPAVTAITPVVLILTLVVALAHDLQVQTGSPARTTERPFRSGTS